MDRIKLYLTIDGPVAETDGVLRKVAGDWDGLLNDADLFGRLSEAIETGAPAPRPAADTLLAPLGNQEVWASGVTYLRSKSARMAESEDAGGGSFYDRVYSAPRPELFFKATRHRVVGPGGAVRVRRDSAWTVPEPELALAVNARGRIVGFTIGNDVSARDIEGENPLYLPQAKTYDQCCALGPCLLVTRGPLPAETSIDLSIRRGRELAFEGSTTLASMKRSPEELVRYLLVDNSFPAGCVLLTGTGIVPPDSFTLQNDDEIRITIDAIGTLVNTVVKAHD